MEKPLNLNDIATLKKYITDGNELYKSFPFGGAGVCIVSEAPRRRPQEKSFYPDSRYVVTCHIRELSWVFEELYRIFCAGDLLDHCSKFEFFGRLANAANDAAAENAEITAAELALKVIAEAEKMHQEIQENRFDYLMVTSGNRIAADK